MESKINPSSPSHPLGPKNTISSTPLSTQSSLKSSLSDKIKLLYQEPWSLKTPKKLIHLPQRSRNRGVALSLKEVKMMAQGLEKSQKGSSDHQDSCKSSRDLLYGDQTHISSSFRKASKDKSNLKLLEKYELLGEFFDRLQSSIRLTQLKGATTTFSNISPKIETLTDRRFSYGHLAQLKFILPEAICIKKILVHDERTLCMKPDLQVTLKLDAFKNTGKKNLDGYSILAKVFRARLLDFVNAHPEGDEIPEEALPEPFNRTKPSMLSNISKPSRPSLPIASSSESPLQPITVPSHLSQSFQRRFSKKTPLQESEKTQVHLLTTLPSLNLQSPCLNKKSSDEPTSDSTVKSSFDCSSKAHNIKKSLTFRSSSVQLCPSSPHTIHDAEIEPTKNVDSSPIEISDIKGTPEKFIFSPSKLMTVTAELRTPKRCRLSPDNDSTMPDKAVRHSTRIRSLKFLTPVKTPKIKEENETGISSADEDIIKILPKELLQSVREKERKALEERDAGISEAKRRKQMIAHLPRLLDMIHLTFQSTKRSVITKRELMYKIIGNSSYITDDREVEEQLKLLQELLPDWIQEKMLASGDLVFWINKMSSPMSLHAKLAEAE
ncbi:CDT1-like protein a, chloroplastic isoform X1 [Tasmannia lanceolata]|uniref:CDT1-like protein a, chloroplastic isoform X1 n=1 Tax=Tasmannia lanceolata TaxID=3420 RepID=UPI0040644841